MSTIGLAVVLAGCGGGGAASPSAGSAGAAAACVAASATDAGPTTIVARDDHFEPLCIDATAAAAAGSTLMLVVRNAGHHPHNLTLDATPATHISVDAGQAAFLTVPVGTTDVPFSCTIHPGMRGVIRR